MHAHIHHLCAHPECVHAHIPSLLQGKILSGADKLS